MDSDKNGDMKEKKKNWLSPKIKSTEKNDIKSLTFSKPLNNSSRKIHLSSISFPHLYSKKPFIKINTDVFKNSLLKTISKPDIYSPKLQTTATNYTNNLNRCRTLKNIKPLDKKNYFPLNNFSSDTKELYKENNNLNLNTLYCGVNNYRIFDLKVEKPKFFTSKILKDPISILYTNNSKENLKSSNLYSNNSLKHDFIYNTTLSNRKNIDRNLVNSIVDSLLQKGKNDNKKKTEVDNLKTQRFDYISPLKYINYNFERDPENKTKFKSFNVQSEILGGEKIRNSFVDNMNEYYDNIKINYNFQKPSGFDKNYTNKNNNIINLMYNNETDNKKISMIKRANSYLNKNKNLYSKTEKNELNTEYYNKMKQIYDKKNMPLDLIINEILLKTKTISLNNQKRRQAVSEMKKKLNF